MWETQIQSVIPLTKVSVRLKQAAAESESEELIISVVSSGDDGVFKINKTSGRITLLRLPIFLKREIFNIKVRVSCPPVHSVAPHQ